MDLVALARQAVAEHQHNTDRHVLHVSAGAPSVEGTWDEARLARVLDNLLDNAVKYSPPEAPIELSLEGNQAGVLLVLRDRGIGLPIGTTERIFEPFGRAANATERNIPGLGLGLYICRQIAERHGGRLWAESAGEGCGTSLHLWLPRQAVEPPLEGEP
jgi:signal transduction histidine kinase